MECGSVASQGVDMTSPLARSSPSIGWMMQAVPQPKISRSRPSSAACTRGPNSSHVVMLMMTFFYREMFISSRSACSLVHM